MKKMSIRFKLMILTLIPLIPFTILQTIGIKNNFNRSIEQKFEESEELGRSISKSFVNYIEELWFQELIISKHIVEYEDKIDDIQAYLDKVLDTDETTMERLSFINTNGVIIASTTKELVGKSVVNQDHYERIKAGEDKVLTNLVKEYNGGSVVFPVSRAVKKDGQLMGVIAGVIDVNKFVSKMPDFKKNEGDIFSLIDGNGYRVYYSANLNMSFEERLSPKDAPTWEALKGEEVRTYKRKSSFDGDYRMGIDYPIKEFGWDIMINSKRSVVLKDAYIQVIESIITLIIIIITALIASYIFGKKIVDPLMLLKRKTDELKNGDYSVRTNIKGEDEISSMAEAFDHMAQSIQEYDNMKGQFFANLSHELKTPINVIYSSTQLIDSIKNSKDLNKFKEKTIKYMIGIKQNSFRLMKLVDNMIDATRFENGYIKMSCRSTNIIGVIEDISLSVVRYAEQKGIKIIFDTDIEEKETFCDPYMIERIILNIISNALKFTDEGGYIYINVEDHENKIIVSIRDTGIGIPKDKLEVIFDRFRQVDTSLNRNHEGSGLGLSIVKSLVEAHGGNINVKSQLDVGTEFIIELPIVNAPKDYTKNKQEVLNSESNTIHKIEIEFSDIYSIQFDDFKDDN